jgi:hypothetical protein
MIVPVNSLQIHKQPIGLQFATLKVMDKLNLPNSQFLLIVFREFFRSTK